MLESGVVPYAPGRAFRDGAERVGPGDNAPQQFVGYLNMQKFIADRADVSDLTQVSHGASSAGSAPVSLRHGAGRFRERPVTSCDSGRRSRYVSPACLQKEWRELWA